MSIMFKGRGFYSTDYSRGSAASGNGKVEESPKTEAERAEAGTEGKSSDKSTT